ncbi:MAG: hypothetical protein DI534_01920 [Leifsonia xyli]|nr:MAG: hypothetical protein DI534_01920 [Leifsonia xyli]
MTFLPMSDDAELPRESLSAAEGSAELRGGRLTHLDRTLLGHPPSFEAYAGWGRLKDELEPFIGERAVALFAYAISDAADCRLGAATFRRILIESGDTPDAPQVTETERLLLDWGRMIATDPNGIPEEFRARLERAFSPQLRLILVAFAGQTVAMNVFATVGRVPLDAALEEFCRPDGERVD